MKIQVASFLLAFAFTSCLPVKTVSNINGYHIIEGKKADKSLNSQNVFCFQIYKDKMLFNKYLNERFADVPNFSSSNFIVNIEDVPFTVKVLGKEDSNTYLDFTDYIFEKEDPELVKKGKKKRFIYIVVNDENGEDALSTNSFYRYIVAKYLDAIRMDFNTY